MSTICWCFCYCNNSVLTGEKKCQMLGVYKSKKKKKKKKHSSEDEENITKGGNPLKVSACSVLSFLKNSFQMCEKTLLWTNHWNWLRNISYFMLFFFFSLQTFHHVIRQVFFLIYIFIYSCLSSYFCFNGKNNVRMSGCFI